MRALVKYESGPGNVQVMEVPAPAVTAGTVLIDVSSAAICGTDRMAVEGTHDFHVPRILGHEASGIIRAIGEESGRSDLKVGDRVTVETDAYLCLQCTYCRQEQYNRCPNRLGIGTTTDGALADQLLIPARAVHVLPANVTFAEGALTEPLAVAVHAVIEQSASLAGQVVVVIGPGAIGQLCAQVAQSVGATVVMVGRSRHAEALKRARDAGVAYTVDAESEDLDAFLLGLTGGYGVHTVFECSGAAGVIESTLPLLRRGGRLVLVAFFRTPPAVDIELVLNHEIEIVGARGKKPSSYRIALQLMAEGKVRLEPLIGARLPLSEWRTGLDLVSQGTKVVFDLNGNS